MEDFTSSIGGRLHFFYRWKNKFDIKEGGDPVISEVGFFPICNFFSNFSLQIGSIQFDHILICKSNFNIVHGTGT